MKLYKGDCLVESDKIEDSSVDLILTDLPYGTVQNMMCSTRNGEKKNRDTDWDIRIDTEKIYEIANRILRQNGRMILFCQEPFTFELMQKAIPNLPFTQRLIWEKDSCGNMLTAKKSCVNFYEDILCFIKKYEVNSFTHPLREYFEKIFNFIGLKKVDIHKKLGHRRAEHTFYFDSIQFALCTRSTYEKLIKVFEIDKFNGFMDFDTLKEIDLNFNNKSTFNLWEGKKYKSNILKHKKDSLRVHPTQKPILLLEDLIKTFSNKGDLVVDLTMGSGSCGVACKNTERHFIGIEMEERYFNIAKERIGNATTKTLSK